MRWNIPVWRESVAFVNFLLGSKCDEKQRGSTTTKMNSNCFCFERDINVIVHRKLEPPPLQNKTTFPEIIATIIQLEPVFKVHKQSYELTQTANV